MNRSTARVRVGCFLLAVAAGAVGASAGGSGFDPEAVLAELEGRRITVRDLLVHLEEVNPRLDLAAVSEEERHRRAEEFLERKLFAMRASEAELDRDPAIRARIEFFSDGVLAQAYRDRLLGRIEVGETELRRYYRDHSREFRRPPRVRLQHLLYARRAGAERSRERLLAGEPFATLAAARGTDPDLRLAEHDWFAPEGLLPPIAEALFGADASDSPEILQTPYGHHVLRVVAREPEGLEPFEKVRDEIEERVRRIRGREVLARALQEALSHPEVRNRIEAALATPPREDASP